MASDTLSEERSLLRLMHLLRGGGPATPSRASVRGTVLLTCGARGTLAVDEASLRKAVRAGLLEMNADGLVALSEQGQRVARGQAEALSPAPRQVILRTVDGPSGPEKLTFNQAESPLTQIAARRDRNGGTFLSQAEVDAGERLRADYEKACLVPRLGINWEQPISKGRAGAARSEGLDMSEAVLAARQRVDKAIAAVGARPCRHSHRHLLFPEGSGTCRSRARLAGPLGQDRAQDGPAGPRPALQTFCRAPQPAASLGESRFPPEIAGDPALSRAVRKRVRPAPDRLPDECGRSSSADRWRAAASDVRQGQVHAGGPRHRRRKSRLLGGQRRRRS
jgi:hypothetical protein